MGDLKITQVRSPDLKSAKERMKKNRLIGFDQNEELLCCQGSDAVEKTSQFSFF